MVHLSLSVPLDISIYQDKHQNNTNTYTNTSVYNNTTDTNLALRGPEVAAGGHILLTVIK